MRQLPKAIIFGCEGTALTEKERSFFQRCQPLGFILFTRNCESPNQVKSLVDDLRSCVSHTPVAILIDQEGGRVARLKEPHWRTRPPARIFGQMADSDINDALAACELNAFLMATELNHVGVNVNCAPVLDLPLPGAHPIISDRAFHESPEIAARLGIAVIKGFQRAGVTAVIKHIPGHGRATSDSHEQLPHVSAEFEELQETCFASFSYLCQEVATKNLPLPWAMTAHICYNRIDSDYPATQSQIIIDTVIRSHIGFKGLIVSDCLTMKALTGTFAQRAQASLKAGCDVLLHCSGNLDEMLDLNCAIPPMTADAWQRYNTSFINKASSLSAKAFEIANLDLQTRLSPYLRDQRLIS